MTSTQTDRIGGLSTSVAVKAPCLVATTANITLSGLQIIDTVSVATGDRVLVKNQIVLSENGIYCASDSAWTRAQDFDGNRDIVVGTQVPVNSDNSTYRLSGSGALIIGISDITFTPVGVSGIEAPVRASIAALRAVDSTAETNVVVTGFAAAGDGGGGFYVFDSGSSATDNGGTIIEPDVGTGRWLYQGETFPDGVFGLAGDGIADDTAKLQALFDASATKKAYFPDGSKIYKITSGMTIPDLASIDFNNITISIGFTQAASTVVILGGEDMRLTGLRIAIPTGFVVDRPINVDAWSVVEGIRITSVDQQNNRGSSLDGAIRVVGDGVSLSKVYIENYDNAITCRLNDNVSIDHVYVKNYVRGIYYDQGDYCSLTNYICEGLSINGSASPGHNGFLCSDMRYSTFSDFQINNAGEHGVRVGGANAFRTLTFSNIQVSRPGQCGFKIFGTVRGTDITITGLSVVDCSFGGASSSNEDGLRIQLAEHVTVAGFSCVRRDNVGSAYGSNDGIYIGDCTDITIVSPYIFSAANHGIHITDEGSAVDMNRIFITSPQIVSVVGGDAIQIDVATVGSTLNDVRISDLYAKTILAGYIVEIDSTDTLITGPVIVTGYATAGGAGTLNEVVAITDTFYVTDVTVVS